MNLIPPFILAASELLQGPLETLPEAHDLVSSPSGAESRSAPRESRTYAITADGMTVVITRDGVENQPWSYVATVARLGSTANLVDLPGAYSYANPKATLEEESFAYSAMQGPFAKISPDGRYVAPDGDVSCGAFPLLLLSASTCSAAADTQTLQERCARTAADDLVVIGISPQGHDKVSACPPGVDSDCIYSLAVGQTYSAGTPDLNADGQPDQLVKHFGSNYGNIDVVHYLGFVQCGNGTAIKVLEGQFKDVIAPVIITEAWPDLIATRGCAAPGHEEDPPQEVKLSFNPETYRYEEAAKVDPASACTRSL